MNLVRLTGSTFTGIMARRLLVNWRIDPEAAQRALPGGVRPVLVEGYAIAGLCLVRLERFRPHGLPGFIGLASENVALRMGVHFEGPSAPEKAVLIFRRDTGSRLNLMVAPDAGYGAQNFAKIHVRESGDRVHIRMHSRDRSHCLDVSVRDSDQISRESVFPELSTAETFFRSGECGYSPAAEPDLWCGARLQLHRWDLRPLHICHAYSTLIERLFGDSATIDSAFIMRDIPHTWSTCGTRRFVPLKHTCVACAAA